MSGQFKVLLNLTGRTRWVRTGSALMLNINNASPLALKAADWLRNTTRPDQATIYQSWTVL
ncbi:hypothetical protein NIE88_01890 [Sporolactobacillus shoreicorticis]|uniref:Uncharacterized protein n=1 Tax=Sporolactobacillus shoreicorticis TaxID=1923877 RepID=A0ABW5S2C3_9BACL|nr:hypothetical protein [Sporolactobacillus shoreicorticis]MCO7124530.1 hypothetical protein [Sporolactobacillus shoreicorticis]